MKTISPDSFALVCFLVLMQNGEGIASKHPDYITEKAWMLRDGLDAFGELDIHNMRKVVAWCEKWGIELPAPIAAEMAAQESAAKELADLGMQI